MVYESFRFFSRLVSYIRSEFSEDVNGGGELDFGEDEIILEEKGKRCGEERVVVRLEGWLKVKRRSFRGFGGFILR